MNNTYYILSKEVISIERFHFCSWDISDSSYVEFGMELDEKCFQRNGELTIFLTSPSFCESNVVICLLDNLSDESNCRFIFNDVVNNKHSIGGDPRNGYVCDFKSRNKLTIIPCKIELKKGVSLISLKKPSEIVGNIYFRFIVKLDNETVAEERKSITKTNHIYDVKVNESRNIPDEVFDLKKEKGLEICKVSRMFCLHAVPEDYDINFVASSVLKNVRKLETDAFNKYLPKVKGIKNNNSNIVFLKDENKDSYSFFTIFTEETISSIQLAIAIGTNIICSLLFAISSVRFVRKPELLWWEQIPCEYWAAGVLLILFCVYLFTQLKKKLR